MRKFWCRTLEFLATFFVGMRTMLTVTCWSCNVMSSDWKLCIGLQVEVARAIMSRTGWLDVLTVGAVRCISKNGHVRNSPTGLCSMFYTKVPHLYNWKEYRNLTFVKNVNAGSNPTSVCMIVVKMNNKSLLNSGLLSSCRWTFILTRLFWKPELITIWMLLTSLNKTIYRKAKSHSSGAAWVKNHVSWMRNKIHVFTKECLLGTMIIIQIDTLIRDFGLGWASVLWKRMHVTGIACDSLFSKTDALN